MDGAHDPAYSPASRPAPGAGERPSRRSGARGLFPTGGIRLGRVVGVDIEADWSLLLIFALVTFSLGSAVFPAWHADWSAALTWGVALGAAVLFFASVLAHELAHAVVARVQGIPVRRITLFLFGGVAHIEEEPRSARGEFLMAAVGPLVSLAIGTGAWLLGSVLASTAIAPDADPALTLAHVGPFATLLLWLGPVNVILGVFNLIPGFPLDGGRVLRAFLWWTTGDFAKATRWAARSGQVFAWALMGFGAWSLVAGGLVQGLWFVLIGWFLNNAARSSYERLLMREALETVPVRDLMVTRLEHVPADATAQQLIDRYFLASDQRAFPVDAEDGRFLGLVSFEDVRRLDRDQRPVTSAGQLMTSAAALASLPPDAGAERALEQMTRREVEQIPVLEDGRLLGLVRRRDILKWLALKRSDPPFGRSSLAGT